MKSFVMAISQVKTEKIMIYEKESNIFKKKKNKLNNRF